MADGPKIAEQPAPEVCDSELVTEAESSSVDRGESLPIIARMVIEIRSDGSRTIARGAVEDVVNGERVAIEASAASPIELSLSLARAISQTLSAAPSLAAKTLAANIRQRARRRVDRTWSRLRKRLRFGD